MIYPDFLFFVVKHSLPQLKFTQLFCVSGPGSPGTARDPPGNAGRSVQQTADQDPAPTGWRGGGERISPLEKVWSVRRGEQSEQDYQWPPQSRLTAATVQQSHHQSRTTTVLLSDQVRADNALCWAQPGFISGLHTELHTKPQPELPAQPDLTSLAPPQQEWNNLSQLQSGHAEHVQQGGRGLSLRVLALQHGHLGCSTYQARVQAGESHPRRTRQLVGHAHSSSRGQLAGRRLWSGDGSQHARGQHGQLHCRLQRCLSPWPGSWQWLARQPGLSLRSDFSVRSPGPGSVRQWLPVAQVPAEVHRQGCLWLS